MYWYVLMVNICFLQFDTRIMCMCRVNANVILIGTLSWVIYAYNTQTRYGVIYPDDTYNLCYMS
jgi:hypothetical protein